MTLTIAVNPDAVKYTTFWTFDHILMCIVGGIWLYCGVTGLFLLKKHMTPFPRCMWTDRIIERKWTWRKTHMYMLLILGGMLTLCLGWQSKAFDE